MLTRETSKEDLSFEQKWLVTDYNDSHFPIWKKFIKDSLPALDNGDYETVVSKLWEEDFQLPVIPSAAHDKASFSQEMDTRQEIAYQEQLAGSHGHSPEQKKPSIQQLKDELKIWNTRNLNIFFIEYLIDSEIRIAKSTDKSRHPADLTLESRINKIEVLYQHILKMLNIANYYVTEPEIYDPIYNSHPNKFDIERELNLFNEQANSLAMLYKTRQFELLKLQIRIENAGIILPRNSDIIEISNLSDEDCQTQITALQNSGGLRRSQRVLSGLNRMEDEVAVDKTPPETITPAAQPIPALPADNIAPADSDDQYESSFFSPTFKNIAISVATVVGIAALMAGAITAVILLGGPAYLAFAAGTVAFLAGTAIVGGMMSLYNSYQQRQADDAADADDDRYLSNNAIVYRQLTNGEKPAQVKDAALDKTSTSTAPSPTNITLLPLSASLPAQSQETTIASTRNANRR